MVVHHCTESPDERGSEHLDRIAWIHVCAFLDLVDREGREWEVLQFLQVYWDENGRDGSKRAG